MIAMFVKSPSLTPALLALFSLPTLAQIATTTSLVGTVTDPSGRSVPNATVTAVNIGTQDTYKTVTNDYGYYLIQFVRIGVYEITVQQPGFQTHKATDIEVNINEVVRI